MSTLLDPLRFPLYGSQLIEASAGTGKTWTIAALYLRLVLGHGGAQAHPRPLRPDEILVMTFTRAATRELSDRIRARLVEAAQVFRGMAAPQAQDSLLPALLAEHPSGPLREAAAWRLAQAAEAMDDAAVHTIDAWCQRMLREHAFDSGNLFDETLVADESPWLADAARDYWRQQVYPLPAAALVPALATWRDMDALMADVQALAGQPLPPGAGDDTLGALIQRLSQQRETALIGLREGWGLRAELMREWLDEQIRPAKHAWNGRMLQSRYYGPWLDTLARWSDGEAIDLLQALPETAQARLTPDGLQAARKPGAPEAALPTLFGEFAELLRALSELPALRPALRAHAAAQVSARWSQLKQQAGQFGFADLQRRLDAALAGPSGERLRQRIVAQTPVAMIDEFQDTSAAQYRLFDRLYPVARNDPATALLLIGDPKQSIYRFRGADIRSYLAARTATAGRHHVLGTNHRATEALVGVVNQVFSQAEAHLPGGAFGYATGTAPADNPLPFVPVAAQGRAEHLVAATGPVPALTLAHDMDPANATQDQRRFAEHCADQIVAWLNDARCGFEATGEPLQRLRPADIAVLVRQGSEAQAMRQALARRGLSAVYLSDRDSVFASQEATDLLRWLRAVADPGNLRLLRAAWASRSLALSLGEMRALVEDDALIEQRIEHMRLLQAVWRDQGLLAMVRRSLHLLQLPARWLAEPDGERRLTNMLHLAELLQTHSQEVDGEQALIRWLADQRAQGAARDDEQIVRLESDADLVKIVTVHKSKGLEYPVVCLPFACSVRPVRRANTHQVAGADDDACIDLDPDDEALARAEQDRLREDLRLFYVALTRARHAVWLGYGARTLGTAQATVNHLSAAGRLLTGERVSEPAEQARALAAWAGRCPGVLRVVALQPGARPAAPVRWQPPEAPPALRAASSYSGGFDTRWRIASFSSLVHSQTSADDPQRPSLPPRPADDEADRPRPDAAPPSASPLAAPDVPAWHRFERGALAGNFLHDQLEWLAGEGFALAGNPRLAHLLRSRCEQAGRADAADDLLHWLSQLCQHPLPGPGVPLAALQHTLPEMEFWLPAQRLSPVAVGRWCEAALLDPLPGRSRPAPALSGRALHGMVMGFADLVFEHQGRYWVLDHKSNHLGADGSAYTHAALADAMAEHRYDVQAALYLLALHRLLRARLGAAYEPARQLGGAVYLFLRGIDGPAHGVCTLPAPLPLLDRLDALLADGQEAA